MLIFILIICVFSCEKKPIERVIPDTPTIIDPPIARAGQDREIRLPQDSVWLDAGSSFALQGHSIYEWKKKSGPLSFKIIQVDSTKIIVDSLTEGVYVFGLKVIDLKLRESDDSIKVTVLPPESPDSNVCASRPVSIISGTANLEIIGTLRRVGFMELD